MPKCLLTRQNCYLLSRLTSFRVIFSCILSTMDQFWFFFGHSFDVWTVFTVLSFQWDVYVQRIWVIWNSDYLSSWILVSNTPVLLVIFLSFSICRHDSNCFWGLKHFKVGSTIFLPIHLPPTPTYLPFTSRIIHMLLFVLSHPSVQDYLYSILFAFLACIFPWSWI